MECDIQQEDFIRLLEIVKSFPEMTVVDSGFKDPVLSTYIITASDCPKSLRKKINCEFPGLAESIISQPVHINKKIERQATDQESRKVPVFSDHDLRNSGDIA